MQEVGFSGPDGAGSSAPGKGTSHPGPHAFGKRFNLGWDKVGNNQDVSRMGYMGEHIMKVVLCSRKEKPGVENVGTAFSLKTDVIRRMITVLDSKESLR